MQTVQPESGRTELNKAEKGSFWQTCTYIYIHTFLTVFRSKVGECAQPERMWESVGATQPNAEGRHENFERDNQKICDQKNPEAGVARRETGSGDLS